MPHSQQHTVSNSEAASNRNRPPYFIGAIIVIAVAALIVFLTMSRNSSEKNQTDNLKAEVAKGSVVRTAHVIVSPLEDSVLVEGDARPYESATLYAKLSGYLKSIKVDKGDKVTEGELLATIESPETDKQYLAAQADMENKMHIAARDNELLKKALLSQQDYEQAASAAEQAKQTVAQYKDLKSYEEIRAPFSGTVTARYADPGALVQNAENAATNSLPLVSIANLNKLRIELYLDQRYAPFVHKGDKVKITLPERADFVEEASITRYTGELDIQSRMLLVEVEAENKNNEIVAGSTVRAEVRVQHPHQLQVPIAALIVKGSQSFVGEVTDGDTLHLIPVVTGKNYGETVEIVSGVTGNETLVLNVGNTIPNGAHVQVMK